MKPAFKGAILFAIAMLFFSGMSACAKIASETLPTMTVVLFRFVSGLPIIYGMAIGSKTPLMGNRKGLLLGRCLAGTTALVIFFFAIKYLPVANVLLINQINPVFVLPLAAVFLGEQITYKHVILIAIAIIGAAFIIKPDVNILSNPGLLALCSAFFTAIAYVLIRKLTATEHTLTIVAWFHTTGVIIILPFAIAQFVLPSPKMLLILITLGLLATAGQLLMTRAYRHAEAGKLAVVGSMGAVFGVGFDFFIWNHVPDKWTTLGAVLIIVSCSLIQTIRAGSPATVSLDSRRRPGF
jgi:drug/metabolite transporter (DMT)-like permease